MARSHVGRLAHTLRTSRVSATLSLRQVEKQTGISNAYLSQLENGHTTNPSPHVLAKLARAYRVDYQELMTAAGYADAASQNRAMLRVARLAGQLDVDEQREVADFIQEILQRRIRERK